MTRAQIVGKDQAIGRAAEWELLAASIPRTVAGQGAIAVVEGPPGIGKTTLLRQWVEQARAAGLRVHQAVGRELERERPFGVMISALDVFTASPDPERQAAAELISRPIRDGSAVDAGFADLRYAVVDALAVLIERAALSGPTALVIDDLQWCDASSLVVLDRAFRLTGEIPLMVLCACRPRPRSAELAALLRAPEATRATHIVLGPLGRQAVEELVETVIGAAPGPSLIQQATRCGGNPLFIVELIMGLARERMLHPTSSGIDLTRNAGSSPPPTVSMLVLRHLSMLPSATIDVLLIAAALGSPFSVRDLALVTGRRASDLFPELRPALDAGLLVEGGDEIAFQHDLVRDAIYDDIGPAPRRALHRQIGEALATAGGPARRVAQHFAAAAEGKDPVAAEWCLTAGREVAPRDPVGAVGLLRRGLELTDDARAADRIRITLAQSLAAGSQLRDAESLLRSLIARGPELAIEAEARAVLGQVLHLLGSFTAAADELAAAAESPALSARSRSRVFAQSVLDRLWGGGALDEASAHAATRALAEATHTNDRLGRFYALMAQLTIARGRGSLRDAVRLAREAGAIVSAVGPDDEITHYEMPPVAILVDADLFDDALAILSSAPAWNDDRGGAVQPQRHFQQMRCHMALGDWDNAIAEGETGLALARISGTGWNIESVRGQLALLLARRDELERATALLADVGTTDDADDAHGRPLIVALTEGYIAAARGDLLSARKVLMSPGGQLQEHGSSLRECASLLAQLYVMAGARGEIPGIVRLLTALAAGGGVPSLDGLITLCAGLAEEDARSLLQAVEILRRTPRAMDLAAACEEAGAATRSPELLAEALELYERFGARRDVARASARLRALGRRPGRRGPRQRSSVGWASLTPTERRVAELVAQGLLYKEVAARLVISRRTVETHVSHIFAKLSVGTRLELTRLVHQEVAQGS